MYITYCIQVSVLHPGRVKPVQFRVASRFKPFVQSVRYKHSPYTIRTIARTPSLQRALMKQVQRQIRIECRRICSTRQGDSTLRLHNNNVEEELKSFKWKQISKELKKKAPTLYGSLSAACAKEGVEPRPMSVGMAASVLLKAQNKFLCLPQAAVSILLYAGHCSKLVRHNVCVP